MNDRVSARPNTYTMVTNTDGTVTLTRADEPIVEGSLINKANMLPDYVCNHLGADSETVEPKDAFLMITGRVGDIVSSQRIDFANDVGDLYLPCDGRILDPTIYTEYASLCGKNIGATWTQSAKTNLSWHDLILSDGRIIGVTVSNGIWYSDNNGATWTQSTKTTGTFYALCIANNGRLIAASSDNVGLWYSDNNGATWTQSTKTTGSFHSLILLPTGRIVSGSDNTGLWYSDNNGATWTQSTKTTNVFYSLSYNDGRLFGGSNVGLWYSDDNGSTWTQTTITTGDVYSILSLNSGRVVVSTNGTGTANYVRYSDNNGITWTQSTMNTTYFNAMSVAKNDRIVGGSPGVGAWYSDDSGATWTQSTKTTGTFYALCYIVEAYRIVGGIDSSGVWYSDVSATLENIAGFYTKIRSVTA